jgi:hypothetical protein
MACDPTKAIRELASSQDLVNATRRERKKYHAQLKDWARRGPKILLYGRLACVQEGGRSPYLCNLKQDVHDDLKFVVAHQHARVHNHVAQRLQHGVEGCHSQRVDERSSRNRHTATNLGYERSCDVPRGVTLGEHNVGTVFGQHALHERAKRRVGDLKAVTHAPAFTPHPKNTRGESETPTSTHIWNMQSRAADVCVCGGGLAAQRFREKREDIKLSFIELHAAYEAAESSNQRQSETTTKRQRKTITRSHLLC